MLGFTDACVNTQIYSFVTVAYEHQTRQAFAIHKFFHAVSCTVCMFYGSNLKLQWQLTPLAIAAIIAALTFFIAEKHSTVFKKAENDIDRSYSL
ncbi:unnamed protein product [Auanema sp. JU1783]|nr:unnamed protein product [Auanema sp. JU1783]